MLATSAPAMLFRWLGILRHRKLTGAELEGHRDNLMSDRPRSKDYVYAHIVTPETSEADASTQYTG